MSYYVTPEAVIMEDTISMMSGPDEMIKIASDGFYVRGIKIPQDDKEAETVYTAFKQWLAWALIQRGNS